jgi:hypothetical protein
MKLKIAGILLGVTLLAVFQNCQGGFSSSTSSTAPKVTGNGQGYDGKIYKHKGESCSDGNSASSVISVHNGKSFMVRENCQDIPERDLGADFEIEPHELLFGLFNEKLFEREDTFEAGAAELFCRGEESQDGFLFRVDVIIRFNQPQRTGDIVIGRYDSSGSSLLETITMDTINVDRRDFPAETSTAYLTSPASSGRSFELNVQTESSPLTASFASIGSQPVLVQSGTMTAPLPSQPRDKDMPVIVSHMICYLHGSTL